MCIHTKDINLGCSEKHSFGVSWSSFTIFWNNVVMLQYVWNRCLILQVRKKKKKNRHANPQNSFYAKKSTWWQNMGGHFHPLYGHNY